MFSKVLIAFSALVAYANAGVLHGAVPAVLGADSANVHVSQNSHGFGYKVDEVNQRSYAVAAPVAYAAPAPLAYAAPAPLAYAAPAVVTKTVAAPVIAAPAVHVTKSLAYGAPIVQHGYAAPLAYDWAPKPYAFGYSYGSASPAIGYAARAAPLYAAPIRAW